MDSDVFLMYRSGGGGPAAEDEPQVSQADDDGYVELRYWSPPGATAAQVADVITRAVAVMHGPLERSR